MNGKTKNGIGYKKNDYYWVTALASTIISKLNALVNEPMPEDFFVIRLINLSSNDHFNGIEV